MEYTQIIATISPKSGNVEMLSKMFENGMDIIRLNFSHGSYSEHKQTVENIRSVSESHGKHIPIIQDLSGPKIRTGEIEGEFIEIHAGEEIILTSERVPGSNKKISITYSNLEKEINPGDKIFLNDGKQELEVVKIDDDGITCKIIVGGKMRSRRGVNLPDSDLSIGALTDKDKKDLEFGIENDVDYIAMSFVKRAEDIRELRNILDERGSRQKIIAKIETPQAIENIDKIIKETDVIMIARGDLGIEIGFEKVPRWQKEIIKKCNKKKKTVIVATQMMQSMVESSIPTRAEVSDVANAVLDGTDAIMLSDETAVGDHPELVVLNMQKIVDESEKGRKRRKSIKL